MGRAELERGIQRHGLENMRLLDYQPWARLPYSLTTGDIAVVSQAPGTEDYSFPSKVYSALAAGSAILAITGTDSDLGQLILDREIGVVVPPTEPGAIASALQSLLDAPDRLARLRANARRVAVEEFSATVVQQQFRAALLPLIRTAREA